MPQMNVLVKFESNVSLLFLDDSPTSRNMSDYKQKLMSIEFNLKSPETLLPNNSVSWPKKQYIIIFFAMLECSKLNKI